MVLPKKSSCIILFVPSVLPSVYHFQAEDGIRDLVRSRGLGDVYKRQAYPLSLPNASYLGLTYILNSMRWAYLVGCDHIDTVSYTHLTLPTSALV